MSDVRDRLSTSDIAMLIAFAAAHYVRAAVAGNMTEAEYAEACALKDIVDRAGDLNDWFECKGESTR